MDFLSPPVSSFPNDVKKKLLHVGNEEHHHHHHLNAREEEKGRRRRTDDDDDTITTTTVTNNDDAEKVVMKMMKKAFEGKLKKLDAETHRALKKAKETQAKAEATRDAGVNAGKEHWVHYLIMCPLPDFFYSQL